MSLLHQFVTGAFAARARAAVPPPPKICTGRWASRALLALPLVHSYQVVMPLQSLSGLFLAAAVPSDHTLPSNVK